MWHNLLTVAETHFVDGEKLVAFAERPGIQSKYGILKDTYNLEENSLTRYMISTWHVNEFMKAAKESGAVVRDPSLYGFKV
jgi:hypothetical protein